MPNLPIVMPIFLLEWKAHELAFRIPLGIAGLLVLCILWLKLRDLPSNLRARKGPTLTPQQVETLMLGEPPIIVDLRPHEAFATGHIRGAISLPLGELAQRKEEIKEKPRNAILLVDETDKLSHRAMAILADEGHQYIYALRGGMRAWRRARLPLYKH